MRPRETGEVKPVTIYGVIVLVFMMGAYALENRGRRYVLAFALGCALSSSYGFLSGAWPFGAVEAVWCLVALRRFSRLDPSTPGKANAVSRDTRS